MVTFDVREIYPMKSISPVTYIVGVDLVEDVASLSALEGTHITLVYKTRTTVTRIDGVAPPNPNHLPPYRKGERVGFIVNIAGKLNADA